MAGFILLSVIIGLLPAAIAHRKGRSFFGWWLFGAALWIVATPAALMVKDNRRRPCPFCAEQISRYASVCPRCQREVEAEPVPERPAPKPLGFRN